MQRLEVIQVDVLDVQQSPKVHCTCSSSTTVFCISFHVIIEVLLQQHCGACGRVQSTNIAVWENKVERPAEFIYRGLFYWTNGGGQLEQLTQKHGNNEHFYFLT